VYSDFAFRSPRNATPPLNVWPDAKQELFRQKRRIVDFKSGARERHITKSASQLRVNRQCNLVPLMAPSIAGGHSRRVSAAAQIPVNTMRGNPFKRIRPAGSAR
jgi:hypothetical protein